VDAEMYVAINIRIETIASLHDLLMISIVRPHETELIPEYGYGGTDNLIIHLRELCDVPKTTTSYNAQNFNMPASLICKFANIEGQSISHVYVCIMRKH